MTLNLPKWAIIALIVVGVIVLCVIFKVNFAAHVGTEGIGAGVTQGLVH